MTSKWVFRPRDVLEANSPSRQDGISAEREEAKRFAYTSLLHDAGIAMKIPITTIATAAVLCHQFYTSKSMRTNDTWAVATACLFLACKVEERPKAMKDIIIHMWTVRHRGHMAELAHIQDREWQDAARSAVLIAERALLYAIEFDFKVDHPYFYVLQYIKTLALASRNDYLPQTAWDFVSISWRSTLCLHFKPQTIAAAAVFAALKLHRIADGLPTFNGRHWYHLPPVEARPEAIELAACQLLEVMEKLQRFQHKRHSRRLLAAMEVEQETLKASQEPEAEAVGMSRTAASYASPHIVTPEADAGPGSRWGALPSPTTPVDEQRSGPAGGGGSSERHVESAPV